MRKMMMFTVILSCLIGCTSSKAPSEAEISQLQGFMQQKSFEFNADWANPMATRSLNSISNAGLFPPGSNAGRINLIGNPNYLRIKGDSVSGYLPYYGERQFNAGYGSASGIEFDGVAESYTGAYDSKEKAYKIQFKTRNNAERYTIIMLIYPNKKANVSVASSDRFSIRYDGDVKELETDKNQ